MYSDQNIDLIVEKAINDAAFDEEQALMNTPFSIWLVDGDQYRPAVGVKKVDKLPTGIYKVDYRDEYMVGKMTLNSDEIYTFTKSFTGNILDEISFFWEKADLYEKNKLIHKRGLLLCGGAGTGKTSIITLLTKQLLENDGVIFLVNDYHDFDVLNSFLNLAFRKIEPNRPVITIIEDVDKLIQSNNEDDSELLDFLDGKNSINHHVVIMTSNNTNGLSEALLRPSRVDMQFEIPNPDEEIRKEYFERKGINEADIPVFVSQTEGFSFAELKEVFIGTQILGKTLDYVLDKLQNPLNSKDYLVPTKTIGY